MPRSNELKKMIKAKKLAELADSIRRLDTERDFYLKRENIHATEDIDKKINELEIQFSNLLDESEDQNV